MRSALHFQLHPLKGRIPGVTMHHQVRSLFLQWHDTPNESCMKFFSKGTKFLDADRKATLSFTPENLHQSPLATKIFTLDGIEEVTVGFDFITVRKTELEDVKRAVAIEQQLRAMTKAEKVAPEGESSEANRSTLAGTEPTAQETTLDRMMSVTHATSDEEAATAVRAATGAGTQGEQQRPQGFDPQVVELPVGASIVVPWDELVDLVCGALSDHLASTDSHVSLDVPHPHADTFPSPDDCEIVLSLKELIVENIRPIIQQDGGDIRFISFCSNSGDFMVEMLGACKSCKSSKSTLRDIIERTAMHWIPEVKRVVEYVPPEVPLEKLVHRRGPTYQAPHVITKTHFA